VSERATAAATHLHRTRSGGHFEEVRNQSDEKIEDDVRAVIAVYLAEAPDEALRLLSQAYSGFIRGSTATLALEIDGFLQKHNARLDDPHYSEAQNYLSDDERGILREDRAVSADIEAVAIASYTRCGLRPR
jgi:hypothetical protein